MKTIGVFFGGKSPEHDISIITGQLIISELKRIGYPVIPVYLNKEGKWFVGDELGDIKFFQKKDSDMKKLGKFYLDLEVSSEKIVFRKKGLGGKEFIIDIAFPAFHGENGEDGTIQGLFEILNIPYVGCGVASSAITMDKALTLLFHRQNGFQTTNFIFFEQPQWKKEQTKFVAEAEQKLQYPMFVKPVRLGSSIGIAKVSSQKDLIQAIEVAFHYDEKVIIEEGVKNVLDITCALLGDKEPRASLLQESAFKDAFFSYDDKYLKDGGAQLGKGQDTLIIPARLDEKLTEDIRETAKKVFLSLGCSGIARVDFLVDSVSKKVFVSEVNTLPGTLYHHLWKKSGIPLEEVIKSLLTTAEDRQARKKERTFTFDSSILKKADWSVKLQGNK